MTTTSSCAMTPQEYRRWWEYDATDQEVADAPHPDDYATAYQRMQQREQARRSAAQPPRREEQTDTSAARDLPTTTKARPLIAFFALLIGIPLWLEAARFTRDGWFLAINWAVARLLDVQWEIPVFDWRINVGIAIFIGAAYSRVEFRGPIHMPKQWRKDFWDRKKWKIDRTWQVWVVWLFLIVTDVTSTYAGAQQRGADENEIRLLREIAAHSALLVSYAILLTFLPDNLIRWGWRKFRS